MTSPQGTDQAGARPEDYRPSLTARTVSGLKWTYLSAAATVTATLLFAAVMGRLLDPAAFGLVAMANVVLRLASFASRMGIGQAIIQRPTLRDAELRAAFTSGAALGAVCWATVWVAAPAIASLFNESDVVPVIRALGSTLFIMGLGSTADSLLRRQFQFKLLAIRRLISDAIGYLGLGFTLAALGAGVWSLVGAAVAQVAINSTLSYAAVRHPLRPVGGWDAYRSLFGFGSRVSIISVFEFLGSYVDKVFVGRFTGSALLGQYDRGYMLATLPLHQLTDGLTKVLFPSFSRIQADRRRVKLAYLEAIGVVAAVVVPVCAGMAAAAPELVLVILGDQWLQAAAVLPFFLVASAFRVISHFGGIVTEALAELNKKLAIQSSYVVILVGLMTLARGRELWAYAAALALGELLRNIAYIAFVRRVLDVRLSEVAPIYGRAAVAAAVVAASVAGVGYILPSPALPIVVVLITQVLAGGITMALLVLFGPLRSVANEVTRRMVTAGISKSERSLAFRLIRLVRSVTD